MRKTLLLLASVALSMVVALSVLLFSGSPSTRPQEAQAATGRPNFVFILADDMRKDDLRYMPKTRSLLKDRGMSFSNSYVSNALCVPSRSTILRGQYAHNTRVWSNGEGDDPTGGWQAFRSNGGERDNLATRLHSAGYRTALIGKYLNGYENTRYVPPGWDRWFATFAFDYFDYDVNDQGTLRHYGSRRGDYLTDVLRRQTTRFIGTSAASGRPFFAYVAPIAPHTGVPAPRDAHAYDGIKAPRLPSFNEKDVSDKPPWIRKLPRLSDREKAKINRHQEARAETLQALDDLVAGMVGKLRASGQLGNTYVVFTSDNGIFRGEHRIPFASKGRPYEEDVNMPLLVRGPGVAAGSDTAKLALNTDYFPTFTDLAGVQTPGYVDGRSLRPVLKGNATSWRSAVLLEAHHTRYSGATPSYRAIRTNEGKKYVEYADGHRELYDLGSDPYELRNGYKATAPPSGLATRLEALKGCAGLACRQAEDGQ